MNSTNANKPGRVRYTFKTQKLQEANTAVTATIAVRFGLCNQTNMNGALVQLIGTASHIPCLPTVKSEV